MDIIRKMKVVGASHCVLDRSSGMLKDDAVVPSASIASYQPIEWTFVLY